MLLLDTVMDIGVRDGDGIRTNHAGGEEIHFDNEQFGQIDGDEVRVNILIITLAGRTTATLQLGTVCSSASKSSILRFVITEKAPSDGPF